MKKIFSISLLFVFTATFSQKVVTKYYNFSTQKKEEYQVNAQGVENGYYKSYSEDGRLLKQYNYINGVEHGQWIEYYGTGPNNTGFVTCYGKPMLERIYDHGVITMEKDYTCVEKQQVIETMREKMKDGRYKHTKYYLNGKIDEVKYLTDFNGYAVGDFLSYYENGKLAVRGQYKDGYQTGVWHGFNQNGDTTEIAEYFYDITLKSKTYNDNKKLIKEIYLSDDYETMTETRYDESGNITRKYIYRAKPIKKDFSCKGKTFNSWKEYILQSGECFDRNIYENKDYSINTLSIKFENGVATDTVKKFLGMCCGAENDYINTRQYEYVVVMDIPCEHCRSQRCFETTQEEIDKLRSESRRSQNEKACYKLSEEVYNLRYRENKLYSEAKVYAGWINKVKREIYEEYRPKYNQANQVYQEFRSSGEVSQSYMDACIKFKEILLSMISIYERCDALDKEASDELKEAVKKATTIDEKKKLLGIK